MEVSSNRPKLKKDVTRAKITGNERRQSVTGGQSLMQWNKGTAVQHDDLLGWECEGPDPEGA